MKKFLIFFISLSVFNTSYLLADCKADFPNDLKKQYACWRFVDTTDIDALFIMDLNNVSNIYADARCSYKKSSLPNLGNEWCGKGWVFMKNGTRLQIDSVFVKVLRDYYNFLRENPEYITMP